MESMRAPSYKAIAMCILNNDLALYGLGFAPHISHWYKTVKQLKANDSPQLGLFDEK
jgi:predicted phosphoadenosine phosphosulfate sulfurtransferase